MNQLMKRVLSVLLVVCLLCSALPSAFAAEGGGFTDVSKDHWAYDAITEAVAAGYFKGVSDTAFDPEGTLTRAMLVTVLARAPVRKRTTMSLPASPMWQWAPGTRALSHGPPRTAL